MGLIQNIKEYFNQAEQRTMTGKLPFVHLFGHEKTYGLAQPLDYTTIIKYYKSWVYACAWKNATSVAKNVLCLYTPTLDNKKEDMELKKIQQHPFLDLVKSANPFQNRYEIMTITQLFLELTGNAYWWIPRNALGIPSMIWNLPANWMRIVPSATKFIEGYVMQVPGKGQLIPFDENEVIHFRFPSPFSQFYGSGPTIAAEFGIALNEQMKSWGINHFLNNANPGGALVTENSLTEEQYQRLRDQWNTKYKGAKNAGKMAFLEGGLKFEQFGSTMRDARFELVDRGARDEILAMFGVPASKLGLVEDVNRANADANDYTYNKETILPRLTLIEEKLNEKLIPIYDPRLVCKFDNPVPDDNEFRLKEKQINISSGVTTIDEERAKEGLEPFNLPETSKPLIPFNLVPAGEEPPDTGGGFIDESKSIQKDAKTPEDRKWEVFVHATAPQEKLFTESMRRYFEKQHSEVMRNLARYKSVNNVVTKDLSAFILFNIREANETLKNRSNIYIRTSYITGLTLGMQDTGTQIDFNLFEPNIFREVEKRLDYFALKTNETTAKLIGDALKEGLVNGESIDQISKRLDNIYQFRENFGAKRTAQTEIIGSTNSGMLKAWAEAGVKKVKWLTARDEKVRESHLIEGQTIDMHQSFTLNSGTKLLYPGDKSTGAPAEDIINCRCTMAPIVR